MCKWVILILLLGLIIIYSLVQAESFTFRRHSARSVPLSSWMTELYTVLKDRPINQITIPGSHDCMTYICGVPPSQLWIDTQYTTSDIGKQLQDGIRYFDMRLRFSDVYPGDYIHGYHGKMTCPSTFDGNCESIRSFLDNHRRELVIVKLRCDEDCVLDIWKRFETCLGKYLVNPDAKMPNSSLGMILQSGNLLCIIHDDKMYDMIRTSNIGSKVFRNMMWEPYDDGFSCWDVESSLWTSLSSVQKSYFECMKRHLNDIYSTQYAPENTLRALQWISVYTETDVENYSIPLTWGFTIKRGAEGMNKGLLEGFKRNARTGGIDLPNGMIRHNVILLDYPDPSLTKTIIESNLY